jgi:Zn-dependent protease
VDDLTPTRDELPESDRASSIPSEEPEPVRWRLPLALFLLTVGSTFYVGASQVLGKGPDAVYFELRARGVMAAWRGFFWALGKGWVFAVPLLTILLFHEFGHYLMARRHRVRASLPMFIPFPNLFGTMGAVIAMKGRIKTRDALVDIGASGPLAGLAVAVVAPVVPAVVPAVARVVVGEPVGAATGAAAGVRSVSTSMSPPTAAPPKAAIATRRVT